MLYKRSPCLSPKRLTNSPLIYPDTLAFSNLAFESFVKISNTSLSCTPLKFLILWKLVGNKIASIAFLSSLDKCSNLASIPAGIVLAAFSRTLSKSVEFWFFALYHWYVLEVEPTTKRTSVPIHVLRPLPFS